MADEIKNEEKISEEKVGNANFIHDFIDVDIAEGGDWDYLGNGWEPIGSNGTYSGNAFFR